jgi:hypothetical protein
MEYERTMHSLTIYDYHELRVYLEVPEVVRHSLQLFFTLINLPSTRGASNIYHAKNFLSAEEFTE